MKKYKLTLLFVQLLATTIVMMAEANAGSFELKKANSESTEERDLEMETSQEKDPFPGLPGFTMLIRQ